MKQCNKCGEWKEIDQFSPRAGAKDGHRNECRSCQYKRQNKWMIQHAYEKLREVWRKRNQKRTELARQSRAAHPPEKKMTDDPAAYKRDYYEKNKGKVAAWNKKWNDKNQERIRERNRERYAENPMADLARVHHRRGHLQENGGTFTQDEWLALCNRYGNICLCCRKKKTLTVDHVIPLTRGGMNTIDNIQPLCQSCNSRKGNKTIDYRT